MAQANRLGPEVGGHLVLCCIHLPCALVMVMDHITLCQKSSELLLLLVLLLCVYCSSPGVAGDTELLCRCMLCRRLCSSYLRRLMVAPPAGDVCHRAGCMCSAGEHGVQDSD